MTSDEDIGKMVRKLRDTYHDDLSDVPLLLDAADMLEDLKRERREDHDRRPRFFVR